MGFILKSIQQTQNKDDQQYRDLIDQSGQYVELRYTIQINFDDN